MLNQPIDDFTLPGTGGAAFQLAAFRGKPLVIYFYPKDNTPGCTTEAQQFRDLHAEFRALGCAVFGISRDSLKSHENFKAKLGLPFELLSDEAEKRVPAVRRHQDEEHVRQAGARHRAQHLRDRRRRRAARANGAA